MRLYNNLIVLCACLLTLSCASSPMIQPQINSLVVAERFESALHVLQENRYSYGEHNDLLYFMDYGLVLHSAGKYKESIAAFEEAKEKYDQLYTLSISKKAATWLVNDNVDDYRGEDFERVLINVFQAINFARLGNTEGALVEARNVDSVLNIINQQYPPDSPNVYSEDAFARLLMGILYTAAGNTENINDAYISFVQARRIYENLYAKLYGVKIPDILAEELLASADYLNFPEFDDLRKNFNNSTFTAIKTRANLAQIIVIQYHGLSPIKHQVDIPLPMPDGYISRITFPKFTRRQYENYPSTVNIKKDGKIVKSTQTEVVENISEIAIKGLEQKQFRVMSKAVLRAGGKQMIVRAAEKGVRDQAGNTAADAIKYSGMLYSVFSEQADLRSWQTLPAEIRIARLFLEPDEYDIFLNEEVIANEKFMAGKTHFIVTRTSQ